MPQLNDKGVVPWLVFSLLSEKLCIPQISSVNTEYRN